MSTPPTRRDHEDRGAALILAIGFVVMVGAISAGLAALVTSSLNNRASLEHVRNRQYAADGAIEGAISDFRSRRGSELDTCDPAMEPFVDTLNDTMIRVDLVNACGVVRGVDGTVVTQRNVIFSACEDVGEPCSDNAVIISARVNFEQGPSGAVTNTYVQSWSVNR